MSRRISRRTLLRGMLGGALVTVGLPPLECFLNSNGTAYAAGEGFPVRFGMFYWGNGVIPERWIPAGDGPDWDLSEELAPLEAVKDRVTVVSGCEVKSENIIPHYSGVAGMLSGRPLIIEGEDASFAGPTIDQIIADEIGGQTRFRSLEFGAFPEEGVSYNGTDNRNPPETSPYALFERVFGAGFREPGEEGEIDPSIGLRRSVLDAVLDQTNSLRSELGATDQRRLEQHMDGIRELELRLALLEEDPPDLAACVRPSEPLAVYPDVDGSPAVTDKNRAFCDILAMAVACDQTRVFTNWLTDPVSNLLFRGVDGGHHQLTHDEPGDQPQVHQCVLQIMAEFAYMVEALGRVEEGDGTLLDNIALLGTTDCSFGRTHSVDDFPILLAGTGGGQLRQGIHYRSRSAENTSRVMMTLARTVGARLSGFGDGDGFADEGLGGIEV